MVSRALSRHGALSCRLPMSTLPKCAKHRPAPNVRNGSREMPRFALISGHRRRLVDSLKADKAPRDPTGRIRVVFATVRFRAGLR